MQSKYPLLGPCKFMKSSVTESMPRCRWQTIWIPYAESCQYSFHQLHLPSWITCTEILSKFPVLHIVYSQSLSYGTEYMKGKSRVSGTELIRKTVTQQFSFILHLSVCFLFNNLAFNNEIWNFWPKMWLLIICSYNAWNNNLFLFKFDILLLFLV